MKWINSFLKIASILSLSIIVMACSHPITITPLDVPVKGNPISHKNAAYVLTDAQRGFKVTSAGGGGDNIEYFPYRDLEKAIRGALSSVYSDVFVVSSSNDTQAFVDNKVSFVFTPSIVTNSSSESAFTWPPTQFEIELFCSVKNDKGEEITSFTIQADGQAEYSEFKTDFGLAGRRAATSLSKQLKKQLLATPALH
jgi:hypothetical protein